MSSEELLEKIDQSLTPNESDTKSALPSNNRMSNSPDSCSGDLNVGCGLRNRKIGEKSIMNQHTIKMPVDDDDDIPRHIVKNQLEVNHDQLPVSKIKTEHHLVLNERERYRPVSPPAHKNFYSDDTLAGKILSYLATKFIPPSSHRTGSTFAAFLSLLILTMANYMLGPMRDAAALKVGVTHIPTLTLASTILALASSVPMGWLFEAPNPSRRGRSWRGRVGLTRGETQGTSLALFLRCFAVCLFGYAFSFKLMDLLANTWIASSNESHIVDRELQGIRHGDSSFNENEDLQNEVQELLTKIGDESVLGYISRVGSILLGKFRKVFYVAFFLVVHLMKLHSISLMWGVSSEAMEYEEQAELRRKRKVRNRERSKSLHFQVPDLGPDAANSDDDSKKMEGKSGKQSR